MTTMTFEYYGGPQRTPEWFAIRRGKPSASRLEDWLSVSKAKASQGKPLKKRLDYEKEIMFERQFGVSYNVWVSPAMQAGIDYEDFARRQYEQINNVQADECGCWYNDYFVASPDSTVGEDGLLEIKVLMDNSFSEVLSEGVPEKHWKQIQGQLFASGRKWADYVAINFNTKKLKIIRVLPDIEFHEWLELTLTEELTVQPFSQDGLYDIVGGLPAAFEAPALAIDRSDSNINGGNLGW